MNKPKNVVVWYSHNLSAGYLSHEELADPTRLAPNFDSKDILNASESREDIKDALKRKMEAYNIGTLSIVPLNSEKAGKKEQQIKVI